jgi:DNA-directed RNA polymerase specialized sigma24 family protein
MTKTELHPDQMYIEGLANNNSAVIQSIYKKFVQSCFLYWNNSGDEDQAQDVVQEVLILLFNQAKAKNCSSPVRLMLTFLLCKRKWLNELKNQLIKG